MGCGSGLLKIIIYICTTIFFLLGGLMLALGILILVWDFDDDIKDFLGVFNENILDVAVYTLIALGALIFILGFFGCCGVCQKSSCMLCTFTILMSVLIAAEVVAVVFGGMFLGNVNNNLEETMQDQIKNDYYKNFTTDDVYTAAWDTIQEEFDCCGAADYRDYRDSVYDNATGINVKVPETCCKENGDIADCRAEAFLGTDPDCSGGKPATPGLWNDLNPCGCYSPVADKLEIFGGSFLAITVILAVCQAVLIIFTCCLKSSFSKVDSVV